MERIAVMIPCLNEETTIAKVVKDFQMNIPSAEIYVFDNNSTDNTIINALDAGAKVIKVPRRGKGNVVKSMFKLIDADIYVMVDGDDTYPAKNVMDLIRPILDGRVDTVIGDRLSSSYFKENKRLFHNSGNRLIRWLINSIFKCDIHDVLTGYRAFSRRFVKNIAIQSTGFEIETELTVAAIVNDFNMEEVVVPYKDRKSNSHSKLNTVRDGLQIILTLLKLFRDYKPMSFFGIVSLVLAITAIIFTVPVFIDYFNTGLVDRFPTLICGGFLMLSALLFFCVGIILQVISNRNKILIDTIRLKRESSDI